MPNMEIVNTVFDGIKLECPVNCVFGLTKYTYASFPTNFCGAGKGIGEIIVPDYIFGPSRFFKFLGLDISIKISPACFIHDEDWSLAEPTWDAFYECNQRLHNNIESIINSKARNAFVRARAMYRPVTYKNAVDIAGRSVFWTLKGKTCSNIPEDAKHFIQHKVDFI